MSIITKEEFLNRIRKNILILDGASGTQLQKAGLEAGKCPEVWAMENAEEVIKMQKEYIAAGSNAIYTFTFGANDIKLSELCDRADVYNINKRLAEISREAAGEDVFVGGDIGSTGMLFEPMGEMTFDRAYVIFAEQVKGLRDGGVDFIVIETMIDLAEARAALLAAKENCDLPVAVSMTFEKNGRTLTGSSPIDIVSALQAAGADIIGVNCSSGPEKMVKIVSQMKSVIEVPILAKPNAGMPKIVDDKTQFDMPADEFKKYAVPLVQAGANLIGGCCGTTPEYISGICSQLKNQKPVPFVEHTEHYISCINQTLILSESPIVISKTINPVNTEIYQKIAQSDYDAVLDASENDKNVGALAMNISAYEIENEGEKLSKMAETISLMARMPVCFRSKNDQAIEYALRRYPGRALVYPKGYSSDSFLKLLNILKKYGAIAVFSPHFKEEEKDIRLMLKQKIMDIIFMTEHAEDQGFAKENLIINVTSGKDTRPFVKWCLDNDYKAAVDSGKLDSNSLESAIETGASVIFADTRDDEKMTIVEKYLSNADWITAMNRR